VGHSDWRNAYLEMVSGREVACPKCESGPVSWRLVADPTTRLGYALLWCARCGTGTHLSRIRVPDGLEFVSILDPKAASSGVPNIELIDE